MQQEMYTLESSFTCTVYHQSLMFSRSYFVIKCWNFPESPTPLTKTRRVVAELLYRFLRPLWVVILTSLPFLRCISPCKMTWMLVQNGENPNPDINNTTGPAVHAALPEAVLNCWNVSAWIFDLSPALIAMLTFWHCHPNRCCGSRCYKSEVGRGLCLITADRGSKDICCLTPQYEKESLWSKKRALSEACPLTEPSIKDKGRKAARMVRQWQWKRWNCPFLFIDLCAFWKVHCMCHCIFPSYTWK